MHKRTSLFARMPWCLDLYHDLSLKNSGLEGRSAADMADAPMEDVEASFPTETFFISHSLTLTPTVAFSYSQLPPLPVYPPSPQSSSTMDTMPFSLTTTPASHLEDQPSSTNFPSPPATVLTPQEPLLIPPATLSQAVGAAFLPSPPSTLFDEQEPVPIPPLEIFNPLSTLPASRTSSSKGSVHESVSFAEQVEVDLDEWPPQALDEQKVPARFHPNFYVTKWLESTEDACERSKTFMHSAPTTHRFLAGWRPSSQDRA